MALSAPTRIDEREALIAAMLTGAVFVVVGYAFGLGVHGPASVSVATPAAIDPGITAAAAVPASPPLLSYQPPGAQPVAFGLGGSGMSGTMGTGPGTGPARASSTPAPSQTPSAAASLAAAAAAPSTAAPSPLCPTTSPASGSVAAGSGPLTGLLSPVTALLSPVAGLVSSLLGGIAGPVGPLRAGDPCQLGGGL